MILRHLDKKNLHHAYLIEGNRDEILPEVFEFIKGLGIKTVGSADLSHIALDVFKMEDARNLKSYAQDKGFTTQKKIFIISANSFLLEAQNSLLKLFEEPIANTHFFVITPDASALLKTLVSRFYFISAKSDLTEVLKNAEEFVAMPVRARMDFIKDLLTEDEAEDEEGNEIAVLDSTRSKALKFLNALEVTLHGKLTDNFSSFTLPTVVGGTHTVKNSLPACLEHFFKVRAFLRQPGSSAKTLLESVALIVPNF